MAFMMPVVKNDWDIYNAQRPRRASENADKGRARKVSESRSEGRGASGGAGAGLPSPHRSAPAMRSLSYCRAPPSRVSLPAHGSGRAGGSASPPAPDKFPGRLVEKLRRVLGRPERTEERAS